MTRKATEKVYKVHVPVDLPCGMALEGSLRLAEDGTAQFSIYKRAQEKVNGTYKRARKFVKLRHGRISEGRDDVRLTLNVSKSEYLTPGELMTHKLERDCAVACNTLERWEDEEDAQPCTSM